ncbi:MAG: class C sortase [Arachnia sp.]
MKRRAAKWRPSVLTIIVVVLAMVGLGTGLYPMTAAWLSSYNQSQIIEDYAHELEAVDPSIEEQLAQAEQYNSALSAGVVLESNANVPTGEGSMNDESLQYDDILRANNTGLMGRIKIPDIGVDLPIYHGTSEAVLLRGAGHLEGSHFPLGGASTHSVITAHRGLANSTMFTNLNDVEVGDTFTTEVFGEVLTYRVNETRVIEPEDTDVLRAVPGEDLITLITCTPLGINSHRIIVTGERIPTPTADVAAASSAPTIPGFPWWAVLGGAGVALSLAYLWRRGCVDAKLRNQRDEDTVKSAASAHHDAAGQHGTFATQASTAHRGVTVTTHPEVFSWPTASAHQRSTTASEGALL